MHAASFDSMLPSVIKEEVLRKLYIVHIAFIRFPVWYTVLDITILCILSTKCDPGAILNHKMLLTGMA